MAEKLAFCPLLWEFHGGRVDKYGRPVRGDSEARGTCTEPYDCYECKILQDVLQPLPGQGVQVLWVCPGCLESIGKKAEEKGIQFKLPGYYGEGYCQHPNCVRDEEGPEGRYSILLQILTVLGPQLP